MSIYNLMHIHVHNTYVVCYIYTYLCTLLIDLLTFDLSQGDDDIFIAYVICFPNIDSLTSSLIM